MAEEKKNVRPEDVETTETRKEELETKKEPFDSSQAQSTRQDDEREKAFDQEPKDATSNELGPELDELPELTGDEETVVKDEANHRYQNNTNTGPIASPDDDK